MKSLGALVYLLVLLAVLFGCQKCENEGGDILIENSRGIIADDSITLSNILTKEYSLHELKNYFGETPPNEASAFGIEHTVLTMSSVNLKFPIECFRKNGYSVYKVSEGGYFYVFWVKSLDSFDSVAPNFESDDYSVYFTTYISSLKKESDFNSIVEGISTAFDVASIDPAFELVFLLSSRTPSYSLLEDGSLMEICYDWDVDLNSRSDLVVKSKEVVSKELSGSCLASILPNDLP